MKNLYEMTLRELRETAKELGVKNWWNTRKEDLIKAIESSEYVKHDIEQTNEMVEAIEKRAKEEDAYDRAHEVEEAPKMIPMPGTEGEWKHPADVRDKEDPAANNEKPKRGALIEYDGRSQNICAWAKELGVSANTLYGRIYKLGWTVEKAFTTKK